MYEIFENLMSRFGVSSYQVSKATGIPVSSLYDWKNGKSIPKADKLLLIAHYFHVTVDYLLTGEEGTSPSVEDVPLLLKIKSDAELMAVLDKYFDLDKEKKDYVVNLINIFSR